MSEAQKAETMPPREYRTLADRLDGPIEDVSIGVSALLSKIVRHSIRSGIEKLDEGLEENVRDKITDDLRKRGPELEESAREAARAELNEHLEKLKKQAKESGARIMAHLDRLDEAVKVERETRQTLQTEADAILRQLRSDHGHARTDWEVQLRQTRMELAHDMDQVRADGDNLRSRQKAAEASATENLAVVVRQIAESSRQISEGARQISECAKQTEQVREHSKSVKESAGALQKMIEGQRQVIGLQQQAIGDLEKAAGRQRTEFDAVAARLRTLEEKVYQPGFFGRMLGRKAKLPHEPEAG